MMRVLDGIRVIDMGTFQAAPFCCQILADFGAEVIRLEPPGGAVDRELGPFAPSGANLAVPLYNRNKKGITLNLQTDDGKQMLRELVRKSDVLVTNMTPRAVRSLGISYEALSQVNPGLVYAALTGYGQNGPYAERPAFDPVCQAIMGHMYITGFKDTKPTKSGASLCDYGSGLYCAIGILLALLQRNKTGKGQQVDIALLDTGVSFMEAVFAQYKVSKDVQPQMGNARPFSAPTDSFRCRDGWVYIAVSTNRLWKRFTELIDRKDLTADPRFGTGELRRRNRDFVNSLAEGWLADRSRAEAVDLLTDAGIPAGPVNTITEAIGDPQIKARDMIVDIEQPGIGPVPVSGIVVKLSDTPGQITNPAPGIGQDNAAVYRDLLGLDELKLVELKAKGVV